jgi:hypothetical protein
LAGVVLNRLINRLDQRIKEMERMGSV